MRKRACTTKHSRLSNRNGCLQVTLDNKHKASVGARLGRQTCRGARHSGRFWHSIWQWVSAYEIAIVFSLLGKADDAFRWLALASANMQSGSPLCASIHDWRRSDPIRVSGRCWLASIEPFPNCSGGVDAGKTQTIPRGLLQSLNVDLNAPPINPELIRS